MMTKIKIFIIAVALGSLGCAGDGPGPLDTPGVPTLMALSKYEASVGEPLDIAGVNFQSTAEGRLEVKWDGTFNTGSSTDSVSVTMYTQFVDINMVKVPFLGPFVVPFSRTGDQAGVFEGTITPIFTPSDNGKPIATGAPLPVRFTIKPSIILTNLQPIGAQCSQPAKRLLGGFAYRIGVKAVGFRPVSFTYQFRGLPLSGDRLMVRHPVTTMTDGAGDSFAFILDQIPDANRGYRTTLEVSGIDQQGVVRKLELGFTVHRPFEIAYRGEAQVAQFYPPVALTGCLTSSTIGSTLNFTDTKSETRTRTSTTSFDQNWSESIATSIATGHTATNGVRFDKATSDAVGWTTNTQTKSQAETSVGAFVKVALQAHYVQDKGFSGASTQGTSVGEDSSRSDTVSESVGKTQGYGLARGNSNSDSVSSTDQLSQSYTGQIIAGQDGMFYRQLTRLARTGVIYSYNLCGEPTDAGSVHMMDWLWGYDLAQNTQKCSSDSFPESTLPKPGCFIGPCD